MEKETKEIDVINVSSFLMLIICTAQIVLLLMGEPFGYFDCLTGWFIGASWSLLYMLKGD